MNIPVRPALNSTFALLDVKRGRAKLKSRLKKGEQIRVHIVGTLDPDRRAWNEDAKSVEFTVDVEQAWEE